MIKGTVKTLTHNAHDVAVYRSLSSCGLDLHDAIVYSLAEYIRVNAGGFGSRLLCSVTRRLSVPAFGMLSKQALLCCRASITHQISACSAISRASSISMPR